MKSLKIMLAVVTAVLAVVALPAAAQDKPGGCTVKITGGLQQSFACSVELRNLNGWPLVIGGKSSLPYDFVTAANIALILFLDLQRRAGGL